MADEITQLTRVALSNGLVKYTFSPGNLQIDQAGTLVYAQIHSVGTSEESITAFGDIADGSEGQVVLQNLDATNYVQWGPATTVYQGRMTVNNPVAIFNAEPSMSLFWKANTAACECWCIVFEV